MVRPTWSFSACKTSNLCVLISPDIVRSILPYAALVPRTILTCLASKMEKHCHRPALVRPQKEACSKLCEKKLCKWCPCDAYDKENHCCFEWANGPTHVIRNMLNGATGYGSQLTDCAERRESHPGIDGMPFNKSSEGEFFVLVYSADISPEYPRRRTPRFPVRKLCT